MSEFGRVHLVMISGGCRDAGWPVTEIRIHVSLRVFGVMQCGGRGGVGSTLMISDDYPPRGELGLHRRKQELRHAPPSASLLTADSIFCVSCCRFFFCSFQRTFRLFSS